MNTSSALVIEDDPDLAAIFSRALQVGGFSTESATNGKKALSFLEHQTPNIIVLDLHLPDMDGMEILYKIRANERLAKTKVIVASADAQLVKLADHMADLILIKPVSVSQLKDLALRLDIKHE